MIYNLSDLSFTNADLFVSLGAMVGCLLPDVDHKNSIAGHIIPLWLVFKHGKQTHTLLANLIICLLALIYRHPAIWGIALGYFTHLFADNLDGNNLKYLYYPFKRKQKRN